MCRLPLPHKASSVCNIFPVSHDDLVSCLQQMPDGTFRRGDVNVLLLGDPSTAKSQFLKFASNAVSPLQPVLVIRAW